MTAIDLDGPRTAEPSLGAVLAMLRRGLFGSWFNSLVTLGTVALLALLVPPLLRWLVIDATWSGNAADCRAGDSACWAFISAKIRFILLAFYPAELQWRPVLACALMLGLLAASALPRCWRRELAIAWPAVIIACWLLMAGLPGVIAPVSSNQWGGLPVSLIIWAVCFATALPLAVLLALARRSNMAGLRLLSIAYIELMRGIPMVAILYFAMLILPLALPAGQSMDKILRAIIMVTLFWAAYIAEVVRGGLQAVPDGQREAAATLGLGYWRIMQLIVLPQALRVVIPGLVNQAIGFLLATSLLAVIGIFDLLNAAKASAADPAWLGFYDEAYLFVAVIYFAFGYGGSRYSLWLERRLNRS
ncbi:general L-amino acid transport system permease protein [Ancylobacter sp. 3268]|uniref:amino acid ABC transporter permease n=1 Tax=Ancylobacter sp. 3268 TaxID=2817752 RepID=UPI00285E0B8F|nr:amino acid ABC transporter permease [Ancylobacter sp. 3268]MDR6953404.1 general L-amino acid transport system permease protein [Ancylobacter sp. 3268]